MTAGDLETWKLSAVIEDVHEPWLKVNNENVRRDGSKGLAATLSLQV